MNWAGKLVNRELSRSDTVLDLCCGPMFATLDTCPTYPRNRVKARHIVGVDIWGKYLDVIKDKPGVSVLKLDLREPYSLDIFQNKSFDVVLLLDALEHFERERGEIILNTSELIARKKVIVLTPREFYDNRESTGQVYPYCGLGNNPHQEHKSVFNVEYFQGRGYKIVFPPEDRKLLFAVKRCF